MGTLSLIFGVSTFLTFLICVAANWRPFGERSHMVALSGALLLAWVFTVWMRMQAPTPDAWVLAPAVSGGCAILASRVAWRHPSAWTWGLAAMLLTETGLHGVFWLRLLGNPEMPPHFVPLSGEETQNLKWWYVAFWNMLTAGQLLALFLPGAWHVARAGVLGDLLRHRRRGVPVLPEQA